MKHFQPGCEKGSTILQIQPQQPVPFKRQALWTHSLLPYHIVAVGHKFSKMSTTNRARYIMSTVYNG